MKTNNNHNVTIRPAQRKDDDAIWAIFEAIARQGETYAFARNITKEEALKYWAQQPEYTFVAVDNHQIIGTYYLKTNQAGPGSHVCNCGYMVAESARGKGVATQMCEHSKQFALAAGYRAMQFNFVASSNTKAIALWESLGFTKVGTLPNAFQHPQQGFIDAYVMYQWLAN